MNNKGTNEKRILRMEQTPSEDENLEPNDSVERDDDPDADDTDEGLLPRDPSLLRKLQRVNCPILNA
jgi:hypothetical protein